MTAPDSPSSEDDYLSMTFTESSTTKETSLQRTARLKKQAAERGRTLSKAEKAAQDRAAWEAAESRPLASSNKGAQMLARMGFKGGALGKQTAAAAAAPSPPLPPTTPRTTTEKSKSGDADGGDDEADFSNDSRTPGLAAPIAVTLKSDRGGLGLATAQKRKFDDAVQGLEKKRKVTAEEFVARNRTEREERRFEGMMWSAMKTLEALEEEREGEEDGEGKRAKGKPLAVVNVLYRPLVRQRVERERERRMRNDLMQSLSRRADYDDPEADEDDRVAFGGEIEDDLEEEDAELEAFEGLGFAERLEKITGYLREKYRFCFWCKYRYPDEEMEGCPGLTEEDHD